MSILQNLARILGAGAPAISHGTIQPLAFGYGQGSPWTGDKFRGSFGTTDWLNTIDLPTLRARSAQVVRRSLYARGLVGRLVDNEINTGLELEATPIAELIGMDEDDATEWDTNVETRFTLWGNDAAMCDAQGLRTFGALQAHIRREAIIGGDVLVILDVHAQAKTPVIRLAPAESVSNPMDYSPPPNRTVTDGVEVDVATGNVVGYWVAQTKRTDEPQRHTFIPAYGKASGRRIAWLVYGSPRRLGEYRGEPLFATIFQSIQEIDRYRDAALRKATINAMLAIFLEKTQEKPGSKPLTGGAVRRGDVQYADTTPGTARKFSVNQYDPGIVLEELQVGEKPIAFGSQGTDIAFRDFEQAMLHAMSWAYGIPPEILVLSFNKNYTASQAALNEFRMYLMQARQDFGDQFCGKVYREWLLAEVLTGRITADAWLRALTSPARYAEAGAWTACEWSGPAKPTTDLLKAMKAAEIAIRLGAQTFSQVTREVFGSSFRSNMRKMRSEVPLLKEVLDGLGISFSGVAQGTEPVQTDPGDGSMVDDSDVETDDMETPEEDVVE